MGISTICITMVFYLINRKLKLKLEKVIMVYLEWAKADRNIQYRVINAIIKERIYPEQTFISQKDL